MLDRIEENHGKLAYPINSRPVTGYYLYKLKSNQKCAAEQ
jgi:ribosomal protein S6